MLFIISTFPSEGAQTIVQIFRLSPFSELHLQLFYLAQRKGQVSVIAVVAFPFNFFISFKVKKSKK